MWETRATLCKNTEKASPKKFKTVTEELLSEPWVILLTGGFFDLIGSGLMSLGLHMGVSASIYQILNSATVIFTPVLNWIFLKRPVFMN